MTKREMFNLIATVNADNAEIVEFCNHELQLLDARKGTSSKKKDAETESRREAVFNALLAADCEEGVTVTELIASAENEVRDFTNQRVSALLRKLCEENRVNKEIRGKKSYFRVAG